MVLIADNCLSRKMTLTLINSVCTFMSPKPSKDQLQRYFTTETALSQNPDGQKRLAQTNCRISLDWSVPPLRSRRYLKRTSVPREPPTCGWWRCLGSRLLLCTALLGSRSRVLRWCFTCLGLKHTVKPQTRNEPTSTAAESSRLKVLTSRDLPASGGKSLCKLLTTLKVGVKN